MKQLYDEGADQRLPLNLSFIMKLMAFFVMFYSITTQANTHGLSGNDIVASKNNTEDIPMVQNLVTGKIVDSNGLGIPGVTVLEKGTTNGVATDFEGNYNINVASDDAVLKISYVGFESQEIDVDGRNVINITLIESIEGLNEVVVVGYGTQRKADVTSAISSIKGRELASTSVARVDQALQGKIAGVVVNTNDASPGGDVSIRIRGFTTAAQQGDNSPLFVIDGVPTKQGINLLNANDIETIDVLKDAAASSIYGVQASNGVVVITTKRGKAGKSNMTFDMYTGVAQAWRTDIDVLNPRQLAEVNNRLFAARNTRPDGTVLGPGDDGYSAPNPFYSDPSTLPTTGTDWQDLIFRNAPITDLNLGFTGGSEKTQYALSGGYRQQDGVVQNSDFTRYTLRANVDHQATERLKVGLNFAFSQNERTGVPTNVNFDGALFNALAFPSFVPGRTPDGQYGVTPNGPNEYWGDAKNPLAIVERADQKNIDNALNGALYASYDLTENLTIKSFFGFARFFGSFKGFALPNISDEFSLTNPNAFGTLTESFYNDVNLNWDNTITYNKNFGSHNLTVVAGSSAQTFKNEITQIQQAGFTDTSPPLRYFGFGDPAQINAFSDAGARSLLSFFGRFNYSYDGKYLLQAVVRRDGASVFSEDLRWGTFPAFSAGWVVSEEEFLKNNKYISSLKLRGSWGESGNFNLGDNYLIFNRLQAGANYPFGGGLQAGVRPSSSGNPVITWETNRQFDIGADLSLFNHKLDIVLDYYEKTTLDMLIRAAAPAVGGGAQAPPLNLGSVLNRGFEMSFTYSDYIGDDFRFSVSANGATLHNEVLSLGNQDFVIPDGSNIDFGIRGPVTRAVVGSPVASFFGYQFDGIYQSEEEIANGPTPDVAVVPGDARWKDISGPEGVPDGIISDFDRTTLGSPIPDFTYGFNLNAEYKNFDFKAFFQGISGSEIFSVFYANMIDDANGRNRIPEVLQAWDGPGSTNIYPRLAFEDPANNRRISDRYVFDGDYLRLRNIEIGYSFGESLKEELGVERFRVYIQAQNLFTITGYQFFDPEVGLSADSPGNRDLEAGVDRGVYPQPRTFLIGANISF
jgi:TonB-linked SusC/RagA family outer membrane protein